MNNKQTTRVVNYEFDVKFNPNLSDKEKGQLAEKIDDLMASKIVSGNINDQINCQGNVSYDMYELVFVDQTVANEFYVSHIVNEIHSIEGVIGCVAIRLDHWGCHNYVKSDATCPEVAQDMMQTFINECENLLDDSKSNTNW